MAYLLKDIFSPVFFDRFSNDMKKVYPAFQSQQFTRALFVPDWKNKELKQRMRHASETLHHFLPQDFSKAAEIIQRLIQRYQREGIREQVIEFCFIPDYIELFGIAHYDESVKTIELVTQFTSCEFAVRPFIIRYDERMIKQMHRWSQHEHHKVRRLSSEGIRPRLPWAMALPALKKNPEPIFPILENLKTDASEFVRRSVANNLNDISKDNPLHVIAAIRKWNGISPETDWIIRHASRTLLKQGDKTVLRHFGFKENADIQLSDFRLTRATVKKHGDLHFSFTLKNAARKKQKVRLEYGMYFKRANGSLSRKVFKISEREMVPGEILHIEKRHSFRPITTRKYYPGKQKVSIIINGSEAGVKGFELVTT